MGCCYDSSILRPLLSGGDRQSTNNNETQNNDNNSSTRNNKGSRKWFNFWRRRQNYQGVDDEYEFDELKIAYRENKCSSVNCATIMRNIRKINLLLWKNLLLRRRHYIVTTLEILLPTLFALVLVYGRSQSSINTTASAIQELDKLNDKVPEPDIFPEFGEESFPINCPGDGFYSFRNSKCLVAYSPNDTVTTAVINELKAIASPNIDWKGFKSESDIETLTATLSFNEVTGGNETLHAAIVFDKSLSSERGPISYKIRIMDTALNFPTDVMSSLFPWLQLPGPDARNAAKYKGSGFTAFQLHLDKILIKKFANNFNHTLSLQAFPYPPHERTLNFSEFYFIILPNVIILGFIFIVPSIIRGVVNERETGIKELMKLSGIPNWMHWLAWIINSTLFLSISVTIVIVLFFSHFLNREAGAILTNSDPVIWWIVLFLYVLSSTSFCFFISSFFHRPTIAITVGIILWLTTYYAPSVPLGDSNRYLALSLIDKMSVALLPNMALYWALKVMCGFEGRASGAQWYNMFEPLSTTDTLTLGHVILMFIIDTILYLLLTLYVESVLPSQYGIRKPWYFIFKASSWGFGKTDASVNSDNEFEIETTGPGFEREPEGLRPGVEIKNLRKVFGRNKVAVDGVSMKMYDGEIFALLGHNGAGKTTTISCCIGMIGTSSGTALINNYDIRTQMDQVREHLGLCPQHNLIFDELTVDEHLKFFGKLKRMSNESAKQEREEMLRKLQLTEKTHTLAKALSGGQKRKLCLGISLIGNAKVVFLDEPTSGMDVEARRAIWDLLLEERGRRTIILTTHFMEEADVLGDRIGAGYTLAMTISDDSEESKNSILRTVQIHASAAVICSDNSTNSHEFSIVIPTENCSTSIFPMMFKDLQDNKESLGIKTMGLSLTTMDEVFIKAGEGDISNMESSNEASPSENSHLNKRKHKNGALETFSDGSDTDTENIGRLQGIRLIRQQFVGLVIKRLQYTLRKLMLVLTQIMIPVFILIIAILSGNSVLQPPSSPIALRMDLSSYTRPITLYSVTGDTDPNIGRAFETVVGKSAQQFIGNTTNDLIQGLIKRGKDDLAMFRERHIVAAEMNSTHLKAMFSSIPFHASPLALNLASNTLLQYLIPNQDRKITVTNHPLQGGNDYLLQALEPDPAFSVSNALMFGALAPIGLALLAASFIVSPLEERLCKGKQLQLMTGVNPIVYWGSSFVWDFLVMFLVVTAMVLCFPIFQKAHTYTSYGGAGAIFLILLTYGYSAIPFSYISSLVSGTVPGGFSFVTIIHIATGMLLPFVVYILEVMPGLESISDTIRTVGRFFPTFGASISTMRFVETALKNSRCSLLPDNAEALLCDPNVRLEEKFRQCCSKCSIDFPTANCMKPIPYITWNYKRETLGGDGKVPGIGQELLFLFLLGLAYQTLLILLEYGFIQQLMSIIFRTKTDAFQNNPDEPDVTEEAERVHNLVKNGKVGEDALVVENLCKSYGSLAAVANLSFGVHHGECFGLLGVNGAGKTTTFRMLTGDEIRSNGNSFASMYTLDGSRKQFLSNIGYCPQFDGIVGVLTGREMVELFGRLRGVENVSAESEKWLARVGLTESNNVQCRKYSGGMKRRLSAAMAMVGDPEIVLLDEPTSGVDPVSRREFWKIITSIRESGRAIILTSHSMDEITACCSRLGIMVNGQLQCIGSIQHLKHKYAQGFTLSITIKSKFVSENEDLSALEQEILTRFSPCTLKDKHQTSLQYHIHNSELPWDNLFGIMEDLKVRFDNIIEEYCITESTLEEVFLAFARKQYSSREANVSIFRKILTCQFCP